MKTIKIDPVDDWMKLVVRHSGHSQRTGEFSAARDDCPRRREEFGNEFPPRLNRQVLVHVGTLRDGQKWKAEFLRKQGHCAGIGVDPRAQSELKCAPELSDKAAQ